MTDISKRRLKAAYELCMSNPGIYVHVTAPREVPGVVSFYLAEENNPPYFIPLTPTTWRQYFPNGSQIIVSEDESDYTAPFIRISISDDTASGAPYLIELLLECIDLPAVDQAAFEAILQNT